MPQCISIIVAAAENGIIGRGGQMPWRMPSDLKYFRTLTLGKPVIMGRKTFQSLGRPLEGRSNLVVTRDPAFAAQGIETFPSFEQALERGRTLAAASGAGEVMVIGGAEIYRLALTVADRVYLTRVLASPDGDTAFPALDPAHWVLASETALAKAPRDDHAAQILVYERVLNR